MTPMEPGGFAHLHDELRAVARDLLGRTGAPGAAAGWPLIAASGWTGLEAPAGLGGAGATFAEVAVILREMGRTAAQSPYLGAVVLGAGALTLLEPCPGRDRLLTGTASGEAVAALALSGDADGAVTAAGGEPPFRVERAPSGPRLHGRAAFVPDAAGAGHLLLPALDPGGTPVIACVEAGTAGLTVTAQPVLDATRRLAVVAADGVAADPASLWRFAADPPAPAEQAPPEAAPGSAVRRLRDRAALAIACDSLGLAEAMLDATVAYAGVREQFGRPIGSFQAVKHASADMLVRISVARRLVRAAVRAVAAGDPAAPVAVSMAKSYACDAAVDIAGKAVQLHGGMGYTWESGVHVHLKRAALNRSLFGSPTTHRARLAARHR